MSLYAATICISVVRVGVDVFGNVTRTMGTLIQAVSENNQEATLAIHWTKEKNTY